MSNYFGSKGTLQVGDRTYAIYRLAAVTKTIPAASRHRPEDVEALALAAAGRARIENRVHLGPR